MTFRVASSIPTSLRGWASAYRDFTTLKSCDADISDVCIKQALSLDDSHFGVLLAAWRRDENCELVALGDSEFELIAKVDPSLRGCVFSCALDAIRLGHVDAIDEDWVDLISSYQVLSNKKSELVLQCHDEAIFYDKLSEVRQELLAIAREFWDLTGCNIHLVA